MKRNREILAGIERSITDGGLRRPAACDADALISIDKGEIAS